MNESVGMLINKTLFFLLNTFSFDIISIQEKKDCSFHARFCVGFNQLILLNSDGKTNPTFQRGAVHK